MSVIVMREEILQVADALYWDAMGARAYLHAVVKEPYSSIDIEKDVIKAWANRLYIAQQCAYILTYAHRDDCDKSINLFDESDPWNHGADLITNPARFYRVLESVKYNIFSNGGQFMLCADDMQKLDDLIAMLARAVVGEYQKEKGKVQ